MRCYSWIRRTRTLLTRRTIERRKKGPWLILSAAWNFIIITERCKRGDKRQLTRHRIKPWSLAMKMRTVNLKMAVGKKTT